MDPTRDSSTLYFHLFSILHCKNDKFGTRYYENYEGSVESEGLGRGRIGTGLCKWVKQLVDFNVTFMLKSYHFSMDAVV